MAKTLAEKTIEKRRDAITRQMIGILQNL